MIRMLFHVMLMLDIRIHNDMTEQSEDKSQATQRKGRTVRMEIPLLD